MSGRRSSAAAGTSSSCATPYDYSLKPGWPLHRYGLEQQAEIVRHYWMLTQGMTIGGAPGIEAYRAILPAEWKAIV
jgi:hypothetical protein